MKLARSAQTRAHRSGDGDMRIDAAAPAPRTRARRHRSTRPKSKSVDTWQWNRIVESCNDESDRSAAVLAGGFVDNYLVSYLRSFVVDSKIGDALFEAQGPLSNFGQRIALAYAFRFILKGQYDDLSLIRQICSEFVDRGSGASFSTPAIARLSARLSTLETANESEPRSDAERNRRAYLYACATFCGQAHFQMEKNGKAKAR